MTTTIGEAIVVSGEIIDQSDVVGYESIQNLTDTPVESVEQMIIRELRVRLGATPDDIVSYEEPFIRNVGQDHTGAGRTHQVVMRCVVSGPTFAKKYPKGMNELPWELAIDHTNGQGFSEESRKDLGARALANTDVFPKPLESYLH